MTLVVDASVAVKWFLPEADTPSAERLLAFAGPLHAPDLLRIEVASAVWKYAVGGAVDRRVWERAEPKLERSINQWHQSGPPARRGARLGVRGSPSNL